MASASEGAPSTRVASPPTRTFASPFAVGGDGLTYDAVGKLVSFDDLTPWDCAGDVPEWRPTIAEWSRATCGVCNATAPEGYAWPHDVDASSWAAYFARVYREAPKDDAAVAALLRRARWLYANAPGRPCKLALGEQDSRGVAPGVPFVLLPDVVCSPEQALLSKGFWRADAAPELTRGHGGGGTADTMTAADDAAPASPRLARAQRLSPPRGEPPPPRRLTQGLACDDLLASHVARLEVLHVRFDETGKGVSWFWYAPGSGVFLDLTRLRRAGRLVQLASRAEWQRAVDPRGRAWHDWDPNAAWNGEADDDDRRAQDFLRDANVSLAVFGCASDDGGVARADGSVGTRRFELILAHAPFDGPAARDTVYNTTCLQPASLFSTGLDDRRPRACECDEQRRDEVHNCG